MSKLSKPVQDFLRERVDALEQLEVLSLVRADPMRAWDARAVADALRIADSQARAALDHLRAQDLLVAMNARSFRYAPKDELLSEQGHQALDAYRDARFDVLAFVSHCAMDRIRSAQLRTFAQAFLLRDPRKKDR